MAKVTPRFKKGIKSDPNNYRPISVIPIISKVFERIVYNQLFHYLDDNKLLLGCQSGFRSLHSTLTALLEATNAWSVNIDNGLLNGVVLSDLTKAFDTIDHEIILHKMSYLGVDQAAIKWLLYSPRNDPQLILGMDLVFRYGIITNLLQRLRS